MSSMSTKNEDAASLNALMHAKILRVASLRGMVFEDIGKEAGDSESAISRIGRQTRGPNVHRVFRIARSLGVTLDELVDPNVPVEAVPLPVKQGALSEAQREALKQVAIHGYTAWEVARLLSRRQPIPGQTKQAARTPKITPYTPGIKITEATGRKLRKKRQPKGRKGSA
jgi:transcriptional regulator with XRE-family HTH domain